MTHRKIRYIIRKAFIPLFNKVVDEYKDSRYSADEKLSMIEHTMRKLTDDLIKKKADELGDQGILSSEKLELGGQQIKDIAYKFLNDRMTDLRKKYTVSRSKKLKNDSSL